MKALFLNNCQLNQSLRILLYFVTIRFLFEFKIICLLTYWRIFLLKYFNLLYYNKEAFFQPLLLWFALILSKIYYFLLIDYSQAIRTWILVFSIGKYVLSIIHPFLFSYCSKIYFLKEIYSISLFRKVNKLLFLIKYFMMRDFVLQIFYPLRIMLSHQPHHQEIQTWKIG